MMRTCGGLATAVLIICGTMGARGAEASLARADLLHENLLAVGPELANQLAAARAEVDAGSAGDGWTDEAKTAARAWLDGLVEPKFPATTAQPVQLQHPTRLAEVFHRSTLMPPSPPIVASFALEVSTRLTALGEVRRSLWSDYAEAVAMVAEEAWLTASKPADLEPALKRLTAFKDVAIDPSPVNDPNRIDRPFPTPVNRIPGSIEVRVTSDVPLSALILLSGPEPLLLPDPLQNPAAYREARMRWHNLVGWRLRFCERGAITRRIMDYDHRYRTMTNKALLSLEQLLAAGAPAEQLNEAMEKLEAFRNTNPPHPALPRNQSPFAPPPRPDPSAPKPPDSVSRFPADYRTFLGMPGGARPGEITSPAYFRPPIPAETIDAYGTLITALTSDSSRMPQKLPATTTSRLWYRLPPSLRARLQAQYPLDDYGRPILEKPVPVVRPTPAVVVNIFSASPDAPPYEAVLASLQNVSTPAHEGVFIAAKALLPGWQSLKDPKYRPLSSPSTGESRWSTLAAQPGGVALIDARDRAILALLTLPGQPAAEGPALTALRQLLEQALGDLNPTELQRLLEIDLVADLLPPKDRQIWTPVPKALAGIQGGSEDAYFARNQLKQALSSVQSSAVIEKVARQLKSAAAAKSN